MSRKLERERHWEKFPGYDGKGTVRFACSRERREKIMRAMFGAGGPLREGGEDEQVRAREKARNFGPRGHAVVK